MGSPGEDGELLLGEIVLEQKSERAARDCPLGELLALGAAVRGHLLRERGHREPGRG